MKIALYIEDGLEQIVLTPDSSTEAAILGKLHDGSRTLSITRGKFYECRGGWVTQGALGSHLPYVSTGSREDESTMIVLREGRKDNHAKTPDKEDDLGPAMP